MPDFNRGSARVRRDENRSWWREMTPAMDRRALAVALDDGDALDALVDRLTDENQRLRLAMNQALEKCVALPFCGRHEAMSAILHRALVTPKETQ